MNRPVPVAGTELEEARRLLTEAKLPTDILTSGRGALWMLHEDGATAIGGFEFYGEDALLRSVAVDAAHRKSGIGGRLTRALLAVARERGVRRVWLLTETAEPFFAKMGFVRVERSAISNPGILGSPEFTHVCASTAVCMMRSPA